MRPARSVIRPSNSPTTTICRGPRRSTTPGAMRTAPIVVRPPTTAAGGTPSCASRSAVSTPLSSGTIAVKGYSLGGDALERVTLDGEEGEVGGSERLHPVRSGHTRLERALRRPDLEAALAQRREGGSAGEARNLMAGARELSAVVGAHRAGAQHHDFHRGDAPSAHRETAAGSSSTILRSEERRVGKECRSRW